VKVILDWQASTLALKASKDIPPSDNHKLVIKKYIVMQNEEDNVSQAINR